MCEGSCTSEPATAIQKQFGIGKSIPLNRYVEANQIWQVVRASNGIEVESAELSGCVIRDLVKILEIPFVSLRVEIQFSVLRPDKWLVLKENTPIGIIELKLRTGQTANF